MKKLSLGCIIIGLMSIGLAVGGAFIPLDGSKGLNLPYQFLVISFNLGSIAIPKIDIFADILSLPVFDYISSIILIISVIGTIWVKPWGRILARIYAKSIVFISWIGFLIILIGYIRVFTRITLEPSFMDGIIWGGAMGYLFILIGTLLYPIILLIFFSRPKIKQLFAAQGHP